ncbi:MAG: class I adenylate-forming enzyme family protein [Pseudomonadota bacterium]
MPILGPPLDTPVDVPELLRRGVEASPDATALVSAERGWTWRELDQATARLGANLLALGLKPGDRIASLMPNRTWLLLHYIACFKVGLVATPLNYRYMAPEIDHALEVSGASILLAHEERGEDLTKSRLAGQLPLGRIVFGDKTDGQPRFQDLVRQEPPPGDVPRPMPGDSATIFFTSGSTGTPKGVTHSIETLGWMLAATAGAFELSNRDIVLPASSISHLGGFMFALSALATGAKVLVARTIDGDEILPLMRRERPSVLCMLPSALFRLVRDHDARHEDFASLRLCRGGADKVSAELEREFTALTGLMIDEGYGMTEVGLAALNPPSGLIKMGSIGRPVPGFALSIRDDEDGTELPTGQEGRLWMKAPSRMVGYWARPDATAAAVKDGWLDSGDMVKADEDGYLWFRGRKKQIIVHDGSNICPQEVEEALLDHPAVQDAGVVGVHDLVHGENVKAYITLRSGATAPPVLELIRFARDRIGYKAPEEVQVLDEMPLNATGKVDRVTLKKMAAEQHAAHHEENT